MCGSKWEKTSLNKSFCEEKIDNDGTEKCLDETKKNLASGIDSVRKKLDINIQNGKKNVWMKVRRT